MADSDTCSGQPDRRPTSQPGMQPSNQAAEQPVRPANHSRCYAAFLLHNNPRGFGRNCPVSGAMKRRCGRSPSRGIILLSGHNGVATRSPELLVLSLLCRLRHEQSAGANMQSGCLQLVLEVGEGGSRQAQTVWARAAAESPEASWDLMRSPAAQGVAALSCGPCMIRRLTVAG